jgi:hypothetical protein
MGRVRALVRASARAPGAALAVALAAFAGLAAFAAGRALLACDPHIVVGADPPDGPGGPTTDDGGGAGVDVGDAGFAPLVVPWSTGFENGLADWTQPASQGLCYFSGGATIAIVTSPVHSGTHAASFTVNSSLGNATVESQARCLRQGVFPQAAYYGAWYYVPAEAINKGNWNLLHFRGGFVPGGVTHGLWDVSLINDVDGAVDTSVFDFLRVREIEAGTAIPIATWFHLEVFLRRSDAGTGEFTLYRDGQVILQLTGLSTDDSLIQSWHVGNLGTALSPPLSTVYVDDVSIDTNGP